MPHMLKLFEPIHTPCAIMIQKRFRQDQLLAPMERLKVTAKNKTLNAYAFSVASFFCLQLKECSSCGVRSYFSVFYWLHAAKGSLLISKGPPFSRSTNASQP